MTPLDPSVLESLRNVFGLAVPEAALILFSCVLFLGGTVRPGRHLWGAVALLALAAAGLCLALVPETPLDKLAPAASSLWPDRFAFVIRVISLVGGALLVLLSWDEVPDEYAADYYGCLLAIIAGTSLCGAAGELITLFLALELVSIPTYVLLYLPRADRGSQEASVKYFLLSVFSSALLLFGFSYLYGVTGTTHLAAMLPAIAGAANPPALVMIGVVMVIAGLGFRITAVPFHFYAPDVYQGAPVCGAALLAFVPKVAGFAALLRVLGFVNIGPGNNSLTLGAQLPLLLYILSAVTMTLGNVMALWQDDLKRILAYSSVAHAGYMLIGVTVAPLLQGSGVGGVDGVLFYLVAYTAMTLGAFGVMNALASRGRTVKTVDDLAGLGQTHPGVALLMVVFLFSLIGLPLTAGFMGKFLLFFGALTAPTRLAGDPEPGSLFVILALVGAINAAIGAYYYLRIVGVMYLRNAVHPLPGRPGVAALLGMWACAGLTIWLGVYPEPMKRFAREGAGTAPVPASPALAQAGR